MRMSKNSQTSGLEPNGVPTESSLPIRSARIWAKAALMSVPASLSLSVLAVYVASLMLLVGVRASEGEYGSSCAFSSSGVAAAVAVLRCASSSRSGKLTLKNALEPLGCCLRAVGKASSSAVPREEPRLVGGDQDRCGDHHVRGHKGVCTQLRCLPP